MRLAKSSQGVEYLHSRVFTHATLDVVEHEWELIPQHDDRSILIINQILNGSRKKCLPMWRSDFWKLYPALNLCTAKMRQQLVGSYRCAVRPRQITGDIIEYKLRELERCVSAFQIPLDRQLVRSGLSSHFQHHGCLAHPTLRRKYEALPQQNIPTLAYQLISPY